MIMKSVILMCFLSAYCVSTAKLPRVFTQADLSIEPDNDLTNNPYPTSSRRNIHEDNVEITSVPKHDIKYVQGTELTIKCEAIGTPAPSIKWYLNGEPLYQNSIAANNIIAVGERSIAQAVAIARISDNPPHSGAQDRYTCVATAGDKEDRRSVVIYSDEGDDFVLQPVMKQSPHIVNYFTTVAAEQGWPMVLSCRAVSEPSGSQHHITWYTHDGTKITDLRDERFQILDSGDLYISTLLWKDMGEYVCAASNENGVDEKSVFIYPVKPERKSRRHLFE